MEQIRTSSQKVATPALPSAELLQRQAGWLAPARNQALRRAQIGQRRRVLDLGAGYGAVTPELLRRAGGAVVALDIAFEALRDQQNSQASPFGAAAAVTGDAIALPFRDASFDLVFTQLTLLWVSPLERALNEISRILAPGGGLVALEPDYGGMIEYPPAIATRELWIKALSRAGANPTIGRSLPSLLGARGFGVHVALFDTLYPPSSERFEFLQDLPLSSPERSELERAMAAARELRTPWAEVAHLPFFVITALKSGALVRT